MRLFDISAHIDCTVTTNCTFPFLRKTRKNKGSGYTVRVKADSEVHEVPKPKL